MPYSSGPASQVPVRGRPSMSSAIVEKNGGPLVAIVLSADERAEVEAGLSAG